MDWVGKGMGIMEAENNRLSLVSKLDTRGVVMSRDIEAVRLVLEMGAITVEQAYQLVWKIDGSKGSRYAEDRMLFLTRSQFITRVKTPYSKRYFYKGTRQGLDLVQSQCPDFCLTTLAPVSIPEIPHVDGLTNLRAAIKMSGRFKEGVKWWQSDRELRVDPIFPKERMWDAIPVALWITKSGRRIAVEFERTRKGSTRLLAKVTRLDQELNQADSAFDLILWVSSPGAAADLKRVINGRAKHEFRLMPDMMAELLGQQGE